MKKNWLRGSSRNARLQTGLVALFLVLISSNQASGQTTVASTTDTASTTSPAKVSAAAARSTEPAPAPPPTKPPAASDAPPTDFPATVVNDEFPRWLRFSGEYRIRAEEHTAYGFAPRVNDGFVLSRLRLNI